MATATKVSIKTKFPKRDGKNEDKTYLCFEDTTPPWDQELFYIQDDINRNWFCVESNIELTNLALQGFAERVKEEYTPRTQAALQRRLHNPLVIQITLCRASSLDELKDLLGAVQF